ncbi:phosphatidylserine/phosphatidylglycerophosphate/cardiolipin synthase family protein [Microbacteriaceae bacterium]|nr:phosphatidylserine/phosphatidylglycerophosphate/cardiolipin synthase family protein [Candidatus Saccharibacteria bacterium]
MLGIHHTTLLLPSSFARDAVKKIQKSKSRIALVTTTFHVDDDLSTALVDALTHAAKRGVVVSVCVDTYTYTEPKEFFLRSPKKQPARAYRAIQLERQLKKSGVNFNWLGRTSNVVIAGRTHSKWLIVDDTTYSFGGVNIDKESFHNNDYMLRLQNADFADMLFSQHLRLLKADKAGHATKSHSITIDKNSTALIDGGLIGDSIIYRRACKLAKQASHITLVSQYCPTGKLNRILKRKNATLYFNHWRKAAWMNRLLIQFGMIFSKQHTNYHRKNYLHAKFIIFTMEDGAKVAISGSHNFMYGSVLFGTREVAIETRDSAIISQLETFFNKKVADS